MEDPLLAKQGLREGVHQFPTEQIQKAQLSQLQFQGDRLQKAQLPQLQFHGDRLQKAQLL
jgi:hypothetical protein